jgi:uncharacterized damage-inducible protein DinB
MDATIFRANARYNRWMNRKLYALAAELTEEERRRDLSAFFRSLVGTLNHILVADRIWLARFGGAPLSGVKLNDEPPDSFAELTKAREEEDARIIQFADGLTDSGLAQPFAYRSMKGDAFEHPLWYAVLHFFNHQTHHRGQATTLLMQLGRDPGVTDLIGLLREQGDRPWDS